MKLKKLELYGFKSFADRTTFEFEDSLSALVGPNGSGKSNVADAIKWVLGERSAQKLRGAEMANVIFNGSESRKPLGFAEVKLTIDNADGWLQVDYEEVCIRRRVDRTGQSEYWINGRSCRLKDVRGLLLDTGVGADCYSFIEQGQINRILRASPKERRQVFEEAAGINRFLEQKREAERKLERVANNLARISDVLEEVQRQVRSVKYQAGRARTFKQHVERLQRLRLAHGLHSCRQLEADRDGQKRDIEAALSQRSRLGERTAASEAELESARASLQSAQNELAESRQRLTRIEARLESLAREAELNRRRQDELQHQLDELAARRSALEQRTCDLDREMAAAAAELEQGARELTERSARFEVGRQQIESIRRQSRYAEEKLDTKKAEVFDLFQQEAHLRNQAEVLAAEKRALQHRLQRIENRQKEIQGRLGGAEGERTRTHEKLETLQARQTDLDARAAELRQAVAGAEERLREVAGQETDARADLSGKAGRRDVLQDLEQRAEGLRSGVKRLLDARLPGIVGIVAEVLEVPLEWARAVEAVLGEKVQAVICERAAEAAEALRLLTGDEVGRAELIVLECLSPPERVELGPLPCLRGRLSELVRCEGPARRAVESLLGNAFLVEDGPSAEAVARAGLPRGATLVTPAGESYSADGVWAGGKPETPSLISRRSELAELEEQIAGLERKLAALADRRRQCGEEIDGLTAERDELASRIEHVRSSAGEVRSHLQVVTSRLGEMRDELHLAGAERETLRGDIEDLDSQSAEVQEQSEQVRRDRADAQQAVEAEQERLRSAQEQQRALAEEVNSLGSELARRREQQRNLQSLVARLRADKGQRESELAALLAEQDGSSSRRQEAIKAAQQAGDEARALEDEKAALLETIETESAALQQLRQRIDALAEQSRHTAQERQEVEDRLHSLRMAENETAIKMQDMLERTAEDYGVRLKSLELEPERWREDSPFTAKLIREFAEGLPEPRPMEPVAAWYRELEAADEPQQEGDDDTPEIIGLEEATELRRAVLELADDPAADWQAIRAEIARLKAKVDRIGNVNVAAIRQQEELEIRLQFMTDQKEDLETTRRHQREIIRELNKKSRERFRRTFEQVRGNFQGLFRKLFGGGSADIVLDDEAEDILEAGIEITARPPGKETTSISLLSGGEKALTTVALLFAMFQAKPSPFCLLDEVDAPLDDNNVERFLRLLEEFRRDTQFIIITHNKLTMGVAQVLYGMTMTDGVSRKISVKFEEVDRHLDESPAPRARAG